MIDHISIGVRDLAAATAFYDATFQPMGVGRLVDMPNTVGYGSKYPEFWLNLRPDLARAPDNGNHVCLRAHSAATVDAFHAAALAAGAACAGAPGLRPQ